MMSARTLFSSIIVVVGMSFPAVTAAQMSREEFEGLFSNAERLVRICNCRQSAIEFLKNAETYGREQLKLQIDFQATIDRYEALLGRCETAVEEALETLDQATVQVARAPNEGRFEKSARVTSLKVNAELRGHPGFRPDFQSCLAETWSGSLSALTPLEGKLLRARANAPGRLTPEDETLLYEGEVGKVIMDQYFEPCGIKTNDGPSSNK